MNILLTTDCNNSCNYCFIKNKINKNYISIEDFQYCLEFGYKSNDNSIYLLGGEPTMHPKFNEIINLCANFQMKVTLLSNFIFDNLQPFLKKAYDSKIIKNFLVNANHPNLYSKSNYLLFLNNLSNLPCDPNDLVLSVTITKTNSVDYYSYLLKYYDNYDITRIRVSLNVNSLWDNLHNKSLGNFYYKIVRYLTEHGFLVNSELCGTQRCIFTDYEEKYLQTHLINYSISGCNPNLDIFPDLTINYCASRPINSIFSLPLRYFFNLNHVKSYFTSLKNLLNKKVNNLCLECTSSINHTCNLSCLSNYDSMPNSFDFEQSFSNKDVFILPLLNYWHLFKPNSLNDFVIDELSYLILKNYYSGLNYEEIANLITIDYDISFTEAYSDIKDIISFHLKN